MTRNATTRRLVVTGTSLVGALLLLVWFFAVPADGAMATTLSLEEMEGMLGGQTGTLDEECEIEGCDPGSCSDSSEVCDVYTNPDGRKFCYRVNKEDGELCEETGTTGQGKSCTQTTGTECAEEWFADLEDDGSCGLASCSSKQGSCGIIRHICTED